MRPTSFLNSSRPCLEFFDSLFTAISCPLQRRPCKSSDKGASLLLNFHNITKQFVTCMTKSKSFYLINRTKSTCSNHICFRELVCCISNRCKSNKGTSTSSFSLWRPIEGIIYSFSGTDYNFSLTTVYHAHFNIGEDGCVHLDEYTYILYLLSSKLYTRKPTPR